MKSTIRKTNISIYLDEDLIEWLDEMSGDTGLNRSQIIAYALRQSKELVNNIRKTVNLAQTLGLKPKKKIKRMQKRMSRKGEKQ